MKKQTVDAHDKYGIGLPLIALGLDFLPVLFIFLNWILQGAAASILLLAVLSPIAGLMMGIISLIRGKGRIGTAAKLIAVIAIALPAAFVTFIIIFFVGAMTGIIPLM